MNAFQSTSGLVTSPIIAAQHQHQHQQRKKRSSKSNTTSLPSIEPSISMVATSTSTNTSGGASSLPSRDLRRRRPRPSPPEKTNSNNIHREYQLLQSQTLFLIATAALSFILFLLFTLPFAALLGLTVMVTSLGALLLVTYAAVKTKYRIELEHPLGLIRHLPPTVQTHLTEKSLHSCLSPKASSESLSSLSRYSNHTTLPQAPEQQHHKLKRVGRVRLCSE